MFALRDWHHRRGRPEPIGRHVGITGLDVRRRIAHHPGSSPIDAQIATCSVNQTRARLATVALSLQLADFARKAAVWMMRTGIDRVEIRTVAGEQAAEPSVDAGELLGGGRPDPADQGVNVVQTLFDLGRVRWIH